MLPPGYSSSSSADAPIAEGTGSSSSSDAASRSVAAHVPAVKSVSMAAQCVIAYNNLVRRISLDEYYTFATQL